MILKDLRRLLEELSVQPSKSLGQNFLHDQNLAKWMVSTLEIAPGDHLVELGPGLGALTEYLVEPKTAKVFRQPPDGPKNWEQGQRALQNQPSSWVDFPNRLTLIEKDKRLADYLNVRFGERCHVLHSDAASIDLRKLYGWGPVKVIGNLPYYMTSPILSLFLGKLSPAVRLIFTVQKELAHRLTGIPRTKDYGAMTVCIQRRWKIRILRTLPPTVFHPKPKIDSAVVLIVPRESAQIPVCNEVLFEQIVRLGFSQRRKQLRNLLGNKEEGVWEQFAHIKGFSNLARAEELSVNDYADLTAHIESASQTQESQASHEIFDIVDSNDCVVGQASRQKIHEQSLIHRAVHILIQNREGEWFLQKRSIWKDQNPGKWDSSAAGHLQAGENYESAAHRELLEELGIDCEIQRIGRLGPSEANGWEFIEIFYARHDGPFVLAPLEIDAGAFFEEAQIQRWIQNEPAAFSPVFLQLCQFLRFDLYSERPIK